MGEFDWNMEEFEQLTDHDPFRCAECSAYMDMLIEEDDWNDTLYWIDQLPEYRRS